MEWVYLSPHLDDAVLSCGGLIWEQVQAGDSVSIWTICAGNLPEGQLSDFAISLHRRWETGHQALIVRREEDKAACALLGAGFLHHDLPDCIYRRSLKDDAFLYASEEAIFGALHPDEVALVSEMGRWLSASLPEQARIVCPLAIGGHVDHRLTYLAAGQVDRPFWYYADYPYSGAHPEVPAALQAAGWRPHTTGLTSQAILAWQAAATAYTSQISTFWADRIALNTALQTYIEREGGVRLWQPPEPAGSERVSSTFFI